MRFVESFGSCENKKIKELETNYNLSFPMEYKHFLEIYNGGVPEKDVFNFKDTNDGSILYGFFGFDSNSKRLDIAYRYMMAKRRIPSNTFPIADDQGGNLILLSVKGPDYGKVYFWDHDWEANDGETPDYSNLTLIADSFEEFINNLKSEDEMDLEK